MKFDTKFKRIRSGDMHNLSIGLEYDTNPKNVYPMFLYTPHLSDMNNHFHIPLSKKQATALRDWLTEFLKSKG